MSTESAVAAIRERARLWPEAKYPYGVVSEVWAPKVAEILKMELEAIAEMVEKESAK